MSDDEGTGPHGTMRHLWAYLLCLVPFVTDWMENGHLPGHPREFISEVVLGFLLFGCIYLLHRDTVRLHELVQTDALTGLYNRRKFFEDLARETARARRLETPLCLAYLDVDCFKEINDRHGHVEGDAVLRGVAHMLTVGERREVDLSYRLGGDEFAVLLVGAELADAEAALARTIRERGPACPVLRRYGVQLSFGVAQYRPGETSEAFVGRTDHAMYAVKEGRKGAAVHRDARSGPRPARPSAVAAVPSKETAGPPAVPAAVPGRARQTASPR